MFLTEGGHTVCRRSPSVVVALSGVILLVGCAELQNVLDEVGGQGDRTVVTYECDDDRDFTARYSADRDEVRVRADDETYDLELANRDGDERVYTESGLEDDEVRLTVRDGGRRARLDIPDEDAFRDCDGEI